jgi:hypothetical protein
MAVDMANNDETARQYSDAAQAQMGERISNLNRRQTDFEAESRANFRATEASISALTTEMRQSFSSITTTLAERNKPQWQALGVALTFAALLGGLAYMPIREATSDLKAAVVETNKVIQALATSTVSRQEMDWRAERGAEDRGRQEQAISELRAASVTRLEWAERNRARDQEVLELSRRVEEIRTDFGAVYGARDVIIDLKQEIDRLRARLNDRPAP